MKSITPFKRNLIVTFVLLILLAIVFSIYAWSEKQIDIANELRHDSILIANELRQSSEDLTRMARVYVVTGNPIHKKYFQDIIDIRDGKKPRPDNYHKPYWIIMLATGIPPNPDSNLTISLLAMVRQKEFTEDEYQKLEKAKQLSDLLSNTENEALTLVTTNYPSQETNRAKARFLLHNEKYFQAKGEIMNLIGDFYEMADIRTLEMVTHNEKNALIMRVVFIFLGFGLFYMVWKTYHSLNQTLGATLDAVQAKIAKIGSGDFTNTISIENAPPGSILRWLLEMQNILHAAEIKRKKADEALKESKELFHKTLELGVVGMATTHPYTYYFLSANQHLCKMLGYTEEELLQKTWVDITFPKDKVEEDSVNLANLLSGKLNGYVMEKQYQHKDGHMLDIILSVQGVMKIDGTIDYILILINDITERKRIEKALHDSERFSRATLDALSAHIVVLNEYGEIIFENKAWRDFGEDNSLLPSEKQKSYNYLNACDNVPAESIDSVFAKASADGIRAVIRGEIQTYDIEYPCDSPTEERWFIMNVTRFQGEGQVLVTVSHENISKRKKAENDLSNLNKTLEHKVKERTSELSESNDKLMEEIQFRKLAEEATINSEQRLRAFMDAATDNFSIYDSKLNLLDLNEVCLEWLHNTNREEAIGKNILELSLGLSGSEIFETYQSVIKTRKAFVADSVLPADLNRKVKYISVKAFKVGEGMGLILTDVTETKKLESELLEQKENLFNILENLIAGVVRINKEGMIVYANHTASEILNIERDEITNQYFNSKDWRQIDEKGDPFPPEKLPLAIAMTELREVVNIEHGLIDDTGNRKWLIVNAYPLLDSDNMLEGAIANFIDITNRKIAETKIKESEERFNQMFERHNAIMLLGDPETGLILKANQAAIQFYGYKDLGNGQMYAKDINALSQKEIQDRMNAAKNRQQNYFVLPHKLASGENRIVEMYATPIDYKNKKIIFAIIHDVTERNVLEKSLLDFKFALDEHAIVAITDVNGQITYANDKFCEISKYNREELIGKTHRLINSGYHSKEFMQKFWDTIKNGKVWKGDIKNQAKDGSYYWVNSTLIPFLDLKGNPTQYIAIRTDITERKRIEEELLQVKERQEALLNAIPDLIFRMNGQGVYLDVKALPDNTIISKEKIIGENYANIPLPSPAKEELWHCLQVALDTGEIQTYEYEVPFEEGIRYFEARIVKSGQNETVSIIRDVTEKKQLETKAKEHLELFHAFFQSSPTAIALNRISDGRFIEVNDSF
ncbi:MAG: PAS domain S-box protein [Leptospiraceae bacterium]|nr:PAS domain S-box protein [Leptospiraceae bacterium]